MIFAYIHVQIDTMSRYSGSNRKLGIFNPAVYSNICGLTDIKMHIIYTFKNKLLKENADQEVNVSEKTGICTHTILVQT